MATVSIAYLPWLQPKNFVPAVILLAALAFALRRARHPARLTATVGAVVLVSWLLFITFNLWFYGHALGLPEPPIHISGTGIEYILGLTFGRDQGLFVQVPFAPVSYTHLPAIGEHGDQGRRRACQWGAHRPTTDQHAGRKL